MNTIVILSVLLFAAVVLGAPADKYTTKYDNINLDDILASERLLKNYIDCLLGKGRCTPDGKELKENLPDALKTDCSKCSEKQKSGTEKVIRYLIEKKPATWKELEKVYDPEGIYKAHYDEFLKDKEITSSSR